LSLLQGENLTFPIVSHFSHGSTSEHNITLHRLSKMAIAYTQNRMDGRFVGR